MLVIPLSPWLTWLHVRFLTQLIPHNAAHPALKKSGETLSCWQTDTTGTGRGSTFFLGFVVGYFETQRKSERWSEPVLSWPCVRTSLPTWPWRWNEKLPSCLIESQKGGKMAVTGCSLYIRNPKLIWCSRLSLWSEVTWMWRQCLISLSCPF